MNIGSLEITRVVKMPGFLTGDLLDLVVSRRTTSASFPPWSSSPLTTVLPRAGLLAPLLRAFQWVGDLGAHDVLDGDTLFLRAQVRFSTAFLPTFSALPP